MWGLVAFINTYLKCITPAFQCPLSSALHVKTALTLNQAESRAGAKKGTFASQQLPTDLCIKCIDYGKINRYLSSIIQSIPCAS